MAQKTVFVDDLTGETFDAGKNGCTVSFSLDGNSFEIDLTDANVEAMNQALAPYVEAGRRRAGKKRSDRVHNDPARLAAIRAWAAEQGTPVAAMGRIPASVMAAYDEAHAA